MKLKPQLLKEEKTYIITDKMIRQYLYSFKEQDVLTHLSNQILFYLRSLYGDDWSKVGTERDEALDCYYVKYERMGM